MIIDRQKIVGWILIFAGAVYVLYFARVRLFDAGPVIERKEWFQFIGSIALLIIGTANVRLAAIRERRRRGLSE